MAVATGDDDSPPIVILVTLLSLLIEGSFVDGIGWEIDVAVDNFIGGGFGDGNTVYGGGCVRHNEREEWTMDNVLSTRQGEEGVRGEVG